MVWWNCQSLLRKAWLAGAAHRALGDFERLDGQDIESCSAVNEGPGDLHVADDWGAKHREDSGRCRTLELIR